MPDEKTYSQAEYEAAISKVLEKNGVDTNAFKRQIAELQIDIGIRDHRLKPSAKRLLLREYLDDMKDMKEQIPASEWMDKSFKDKGFAETWEGFKVPEPAQAATQTAPAPTTRSFSPRPAQATQNVSKTAEAATEQPAQRVSQKVAPRYYSKSSEAPKTEPAKVEAATAPKEVAKPEITARPANRPPPAPSATPTSMALKPEQIANMSETEFNSMLPSIMQSIQSTVSNQENT